IMTETGVKESLLSPSQKATSLQFTALNSDTVGILKKNATDFVDLRGVRSAEMIKKLTPFSGTYKFYGIASDKGHGHALGAYFPWMGKNQFYDPNLVAGPCSEDKWLYELLAMWPGLYLGCGEQGATWGFEYLYVFNDPKMTIEALGK